MIVSQATTVRALFGLLAASLAACSGPPEAETRAAEEPIEQPGAAAAPAPGPPSTTSPPPCAAPPTSADPSDCNAPLVSGADRRCTMQVGGRTRELLIYAPPSYNACAPSALVVDAHGAQETAAAHAGKEQFFDWPGGLGSGWRLVADREGFIVVQPQGIGNAWSQADAEFMLKIPAYVESLNAVDKKRVYMTGISNGGALTYWTACQDTGIFQGFAPVSGFDSAPCDLSHHAPVIAFHAPTDRLVSLSSGQSAFQMLRSKNNCQRGPQPSWSFGGGSTDPRALCLASTGGGAGAKWSLTPCDAAAEATTCQLWNQCDDDVAATFCTVAPDLERHFDRMGGHILYWNGTNLSLAAVAWEFFRTHQ